VSPPGDAPPSTPATKTETWRCFVAVSLADPARAAVVEYLARLRATSTGVAWTRPDQLHLTLQFLGNVEPARLPSLTGRLRAALASVASFEMQVGGIGAFPNVSRPQVLWVGLTAPEVGALAAGVQGACAGAGFPPEQRTFRPHVTLGRVRTRSRRDAPDLGFLARDGALQFGMAPVTRVVLYRSELGAAGARHSILEDFPLLAR
jgi:2'-5' RNA ligase